MVLIHGDKQKELSGGRRLTTNNRMEMMAAIEGLQALKSPSTVTLYSDSQYLVNAMEKRWAERWRKNGWMRTKSERAINSDLWQMLLELCQNHKVSFRWVKGHAGHPLNERCDHLATSEARKTGLPADEIYESTTTRRMV